MLEFTDYGAIIPAMRLNNTDLNEKEIKVPMFVCFWSSNPEEGLINTSLFSEVQYLIMFSGLLLNPIDHEAEGQEQWGLAEGDWGGDEEGEGGTEPRLRHCRPPDGAAQ